MKLYFPLAIALLAAMAVGCDTPVEKAPAPAIPEAVAAPEALINPFVGTGGHGHTFPGATVPFGMVQLSPDSRLDGWDGCGGYHYSDSVLYGFSHTHLSGTGVSDYGDVLLMPFTGETKWENGAENGPDNGYASRFDKSTEVAEAGYYKAQLTDYNITAELTATKRVGLHRYAFPADAVPKVMLDLHHRDKALNVKIEQISDTEIVGHRVSQAWAEEQHVYFVAQFSRAMTTLELDGSALLGKLLTGEGKDPRQVCAVFEASEEPLLVKVGISAVDIDGARKNLNAELPGWDFDATHTAATQAWNTAMNKLTVHGGTPEQQGVFYTALYHSMVAPNVFSDVDGRYRGHDMQIHEDKTRDTYTVFSLWDTFRATHPLFTLIEQKRTNDFINTFLKNYEQGGVLPVWELAGNETFCMIGYHSVPVIADAYVKGIRDWDVNAATNAMVAGAEADRFGLESYRTYGFIRAGDEAESVSKTLEYAYDDWCIANMLNEQGNTEAANHFMQRALSYRNIFDPSSGFFRGRMHGSWFEPFDPREVNYHFTEANAWQYSLFVPQDITGLMNLMGGEAGFEKHVDKLFVAESATTGREQADITGLIGQYAHGNEPSHHMAYLYNYIGKPWKSQQRVRQIMDELYTTQPDGLSGNEDCGQMSSWFVMSAMGLYSVTPGTDYYAIGTPLFPQVSMNLENGKTFSIQAPNVSDKNIYIQSATLNGQPHTASFIRHSDIMAGGMLAFEMGPEPNKNWGSAQTDRPKAAIDLEQFATAPFFMAEARTFTEQLSVELATASTGQQIFYTLDGSEPSPNSTPYSEPIVLTETTTIKTMSTMGSAHSKVIEAQYLKVEGGRSIVLNTEYANQYAAGGDDALINYLRGAAEYRTGMWQGYREDLEAIVDLGAEKPVKRIAIGFLQDVKSWIWMPQEVEFAISTDGENFTTVATVGHNVPAEQYGGITHDIATAVNANARYVRVRAKQFGECPEWHLGAGGATWLFADEIVIE